MGDMALGYGSEWHLLRFMGRHRKCLTTEVLKTIGQGTHIDWLDFNFHPAKKKHFDVEHKGLAFLKGTSYRSLHDDWSNFWPQSGNRHNWDGVGWLYDKCYPQKPAELLLVEAKAHTEELKSNCGAKNINSSQKIQSSLDKVKGGLGVDINKDWLRGYYQYANRIAALWFLRNAGIPCRLVFIYFIADSHAGTKCPQKKDEWVTSLTAQDAHLGLSLGHPLEGYIHKVFLNVKG